jgi:hypothetical protein
MTKSKRLLFKANGEFIFDKSTGAIVLRLGSAVGYVDIFLSLSEVKQLNLPLRKLENFNTAKFNEYYMPDGSVIFDGVRWYNS